MNKYLVILMLVGFSPVFSETNMPELLDRIQSKEFSIENTLEKEAAVMALKAELMTRTQIFNFTKETYAHNATSKEEYLAEEMRYEVVKAKYAEKKADLNSAKVQENISNARKQIELGKDVDLKMLTRLYIDFFVKKISQVDALILQSEATKKFVDFDHGINEELYKKNAISTVEFLKSKERVTLVMVSIDLNGKRLQLAKSSKLEYEEVLKNLK